MRRKTPDILAGVTYATDDVALAMGGPPQAPAIITPFRYEDLDTETRIVVQQRTGEIKTLMRQTAQGVMEIGGKLIEVKDRLGHGRFGYWLNQEFGWSDRTARNFMAVARQFKSEIISDLDLAPSALIALSGATVPEAARQEAVEQAASGQQVTVKTAKQIIAKHKPAAPRSEPQPYTPPQAPTNEPMTPYQLVQSWLASRFDNFGQRRFAVLDMLRSKKVSQYWPSMTRLLPDSDESEILMVLDAVRSDFADEPEPARVPPPAARVTFQSPAPKPSPTAEQRLDALRNRLADLLSLPRSASDDELLDAVEIAVIAWQLSEEAAR